MISKLKNIYKKSDLDEKNNFRKRVLDILGELFPDLEFATDDDLEVIRTGSITLGLTNLYSKYLLTSQTNIELKELMQEHFAGLLEIAQAVEKKQNVAWEQAKTLVMPQLMPTEYVERMPVINYTLGEEVCIGIVIDDEKSYSYVTEDNLREWNISDEELYQAAIDNLTAKSQNLELMFVPPPNGFVAIGTMDGFDAARILVPQMVEFFAEKLGSPFYFGIPNRDFLICWSKQGDKDFQKTMRRQISSDFEERPYPLSKYAFEIHENGQIQQSEALHTDESSNQDWIRKN